MSRKIALIGLGDIAQKVYLPLLAQDETVEIVGIASRTPETTARLAARYRLPSADSLAGLIKRGPEAVFVHSPTETHYTIINPCLEAGIPVYVDKPISYQLHECEELAELALRRGVLLAVGFNRRFAPLYQEARRWVETSASGVEWMDADKHRTRKQRISAEWTVFDDLIHMLDLLLWIGGGSYESAGHRLLKDTEGRMTAASGTLALGGATARYGMYREAGWDTERLELHGGGRSAVVTDLETIRWSDKSNPPHERSFGSWDTILHRRGFAQAVRHFLDTLDRPAECAIRADNVIATHRLAAEIARG